MTVVRMGYRRKQVFRQSEGLILQPGADPPTIVPYCGICDQPVDGLQFDIPTDGAGMWRVGVHGRCCGQTRSAYLSTEQVMRIKRTNEKFYIIPAKGHVQTIKEQKKR